MTNILQANCLKVPGPILFLGMRCQCCQITIQAFPGLTSSTVLFSVNITAIPSSLQFKAFYFHVARTVATGQLRGQRCDMFNPAEVDAGWGTITAISPNVEPRSMSNCPLQQPVSNVFLSHSLFKHQTIQLSLCTKQKDPVTKLERTAHELSGISVFSTCR